jgi:hypothetical protein
MRPNQEAFVRTYRKDFTDQERLTFKTELISLLQDCPDTLNNLLAGLGFDDKLAEKLIKDSIEKVNNTRIPQYLLV